MNKVIFILAIIVLILPAFSFAGEPEEVDDYTFEFVILEKFKTAEYSSIHQSDAITYMDKWAENSGLFEVEGYEKRRIGWIALLDRRGIYVSAYVIPEDFIPKNDDAKIKYGYIEGLYAKVTIADLYNNFRNMPDVSTHAKISSWTERFLIQEEYEVDGVLYMDIYIPVDEIYDTKPESVKVFTGVIE